MIILKRVIVKSVHEAFDYVMEHYYPFGMADEAAPFSDEKIIDKPEAIL